jgi:hypothetical protein
MGLEVDCFSVIRDGVIPIAGGLVNSSAADVRISERGVDLYCLRVISNRAVAIPLRNIAIARL